MGRALMLLTVLAVLIAAVVVGVAGLFDLGGVLDPPPATSTVEPR